MVPHRFENTTEFDLAGFWDPISASIDWCEHNYVVSWYIAEFWNCLSSFTIFAIGVIGLYQSRVRKLETSFEVLNWSIMAVGLGSVLFHGTLTYVGQLLDELPMIWSMLVWWYLIMTIEAPSSQKYPRLALSLTIYAVSFSILHAYQAFTRVFQLHFLVLTLIEVYYVVSYTRRYSKIYPSVGHLAWVYIGIALVAFVGWLIDQFFCSNLYALDFPSLQIRVPNPQLHAIWHALNAYSIYAGMVFGRSIRFISLYGKAPKIEWKYCWPLASDHKSKGY